MKEIYLCSTLKAEWNRTFNPNLCEALEKAGFSIYLPQRDTNQSGAGPEILAQNMKAMKNAKLLIGIAKNASPNFGAEVGYFFGCGKPVLILAESFQEIPLMTTGMVTDIVILKSLGDVSLYSAQLSRVLAKILQGGSPATQA